MPFITLGNAFNYYCPQHSCGKIMFLHLSVSHSVHRGVYPSMYWGRHPPGADISQHALGQTNQWADTLWADANRQTPRADTPQVDTPTLGRWLLMRTVRILLECILVWRLLFGLTHWYSFLFSLNTRRVWETLCHVVKMLSKFNPPLSGIATSHGSWI